MALQLSDVKVLRTAVLDEHKRWFMYFQTPDGAHTYRSSMSFNEQYDPGPYGWLTSTLASQSRSWPAVSASLGPDDSLFIAMASGECSFAPGLPPTTAKAVRRVRAGQTLQVAQGVHDAHVILHGRRKTSWSLGDGYPVLADILEKVRGRYHVSLTWKCLPHQFVALNPWKHDEFFLMLEDKVCFFHAAPAIHANVVAALSAAGIPANVVRRDGTQGLRSGMDKSMNTRMSEDRNSYGDGRPSGKISSSTRAATTTTTTVCAAGIGVDRDELCGAIETAIMGYNFMNLAGGAAPVTAAAGCSVM
ncbi:hypothetical protein HOO65_030503 [Ceratocystis lukuohia]|uniref:Uncharacterized protein n=2 Tax=Ceratocystis TaxID=5157 RepID=A0A0F8B0Z5_CERFI|nr:hypothetical protein CFO_g2938 [Ceratocystis platani]